MNLLPLLPVGVVILNQHGCIDYSNPAADGLLGQALQGKFWRNLISSTFAPQHDDGHEVSLCDGRRVRIATRALEDKPGQLLVLTDLTETRSHQARINHNQRLAEMGKMTASVAHQIRTPLSVALLSAENLQHDTLTMTQRDRFTQRIIQSLGVVEEKIRDMLLYARGEQMVKASYCLQVLINDIRQSFDAEQVALTIHCDNPNIPFVCNHDALLGALQNLIQNSIQAQKNRAAVIIKIKQYDNNLLFSVSDNGPGIPRKIKDKVIQPFFTTKTQGTGLGLAVAQAVAKSHQGKMWIDDENINGAKICIEIPIKSEQEIV